MDYDSPGYEGAGHDSPGYDGAGYDSPGYDGAGYGSAGYDSAGYDSPGYDSAGQSGGYESGGHHANGYDSGGYRADDYSADDYRGGAQQADGYGGYAEPGGYLSSDDGSGGHAAQRYHSAPYDTTYDGDSSYGSGGYPSPRHASGGYPALGSGGYPSPRHASGGYPALGSGGYPALGQESGEYPGLDSDSGDGNDWYARSGPIPASGFADTSAQPAIRDTPSRDLVPRGAMSRGPVRGYPPEPGRPDPGLATTRQQVRYDESAYVSYPGYDDEVQDDAQGYDSRRGYDDYDDATRLDQVAVDYDSPRDPRGGRGYGPAPQGAGLEGGGRGDPSQPGDVLTGPGKKPRRSGKPRKPDTDQPKRRRRRVLAAVAVSVVVVAAAGYGGYQFLLKSKATITADQQVSQPLPSASIASATQKCAQQLGEYCHIELRADDPAPLTVSEVFPPAVFSTASKMGFLLAGTRVDKNCASAVYGSGLAGQLKKGGCSQALRASYVSQDKTIMGTIGVFNMNTTNDAHYAARIINASNFVLPLSSAHGIIAKLGQGTGVVEPEFKGHYLILTWAEFSNLKAPSTKAQAQQLENWENSLVANTANVYLSQVMVHGDSPAASATPPASATPKATATR